MSDNPIPKVEIASQTSNIKSGILPDYNPFMNVLEMYLDVDRRENNAQIVFLFEKDDTQDFSLSITTVSESEKENTPASGSLSFADYGINVSEGEGVMTDGASAYEVTLDFEKDSEHVIADGIEIIAEAKSNGKDPKILLIYINEDMNY